MKKYDRRITAMLGAVIIHLIAGIIFMLFQLHSLQEARSGEFEVEYIPEKKQEVKVEGSEKTASTVETILNGDREMLNIARNLANKPTEKINPADYIDKVKEELIKSGKLGTDNYIDEQKKQKENNTDLNAENENPALKNESDKKKDEAVKMAANFQGPTRIYYDLQGRNHLYLPIPIYKCQGSGIVVMFIEVDQKGTVEKATIIEDKSTTADPCLVETAVNSAMISRFNSDVNSPKVQRGTLTYQFVAQ
jgi:hypothetical protein